MAKGKRGKGGKRLPKKSKKKAAAEAKAAEEEGKKQAEPSDGVEGEFTKGIIATYGSSARGAHANVRDISVTNLSVSFHGHRLVEECQLTLSYGQRYGLIGPNGSGKTTLLKVLGHRMVYIPENIDIFYLDREFEATEMTALEAVLSVDEARERLEKEADDLSNRMAEGDDDDSITTRLEELYERLESMDAATAETRAASILAGLQFTPEMQKKKTREFSGGWRMRISLARALFLGPSLLLLDEPTNHLDMEAVVWLEEYLASFRSILVLISHSQDFMNNVCTNIINLKARSLTYYSGNYDQYVQTKREKEEEQMKRYRWEQDQIAHMKEYIARFGHGSAKLARQAQSKEKTLAKMIRAGLTEEVKADQRLAFKFLDPGPLPPPVLQFQNVAFRYNDDLPYLYNDVSFGIDLDSRVALVGPNGAGKTTLLKLMLRQLMPTQGMVRPHQHLRIALYHQHTADELPMEKTSLEYMRSSYPDHPGGERGMRQWLGRYGITGTLQVQVIAHMSDGQRSRLVFAWMALKHPHILFLDEPTNHLDIETIDSLADAINNFSGGMVLVSHDMRLIQQVAREIWEVRDRAVTVFPGDISEYKLELKRRMQML